MSNFIKITNDKLNTLQTKVDAVAPAINANVATEATATLLKNAQIDGTQKAKVMGSETDGTQQQLLVSNLGVLQTLDSEVFGKTSQIANQTTLSNTNEAEIIANQTDGTQKAMCMGINGGLQVQLGLEANGSLVIGGGAVKTGIDETGSTQHIRTDTNGRLSVDINSGVPTKTSGSAGHSPPTGIGLIGFEGSTARAVATDSSGVLSVNVLSGAGSTAPVLENITFADITTGSSGYSSTIDLTGFSHFNVAIIDTTTLSSASAVVEFSYDGGTTFVGSDGSGDAVRYPPREFYKPDPSSGSGTATGETRYGFIINSGSGVLGSTNSDIGTPRSTKMRIGIQNNTGSTLNTAGFQSATVYKY